MDGYDELKFDNFEEYKKQGEAGTFNLPGIPGSSKCDYPENGKNYPENYPENRKNYPENFRGFKGQSAGYAQRIGGKDRHNSGRDQVEFGKAEKSGQTAPRRSRQRREMGYN